MANEHDEDEVEGEGEGEYLETVTLGELIADLQAIASELGNDVPVFMTTRSVEEDDFEETFSLYDITAGAPDPEFPNEYVVLLNGIADVVEEEEEE